MFRNAGCHTFVCWLLASCNGVQRGMAAAAILQRNISGPAVKRIILMLWHPPCLAFYCLLSLVEGVERISGLVKILVDFSLRGTSGGFKAPVICMGTTRWVILLYAAIFFNEHIGLLLCYVLSGFAIYIRPKGICFVRGLMNPNV